MPPEAQEPKAKSQEPDSGLVGNAATVGFWTIASRILGLYRFRLLAGIFGATGVADAFNFAFIFPNLTRRLFGEGLLTSAFVPVFSERLAKDQKEAAFRTGSVLLCRMAWWLTLGCIAVIALAGVARIVLPSVMTLDPRFVLEIQLFQWMLPYLIFINVAAVLMGILNSLGHFHAPAFAPVLLNVVIIGACLWVRFGPENSSPPEHQIWLVAAAVLLGGAFQLLIQIPPARARGFRFTPSMDKSDPGYQEVMANFKPVVLMVAVFQANVMLDNIIAQVFIPEPGPVTYLNMGTSVYQLVWSIIALALGTAALPLLSGYWAQARREDFIRTLDKALRLVIYLAVPATVGIMLLSEDIVRLLYGTGRFLENDGEPVRRTAAVVMFSSLGLVFFSVNALLARALYAMKDMRTPTTTSAKSVAINVVLNLVFVLGSPKLGYPMKESGIALASTISSAWQTWMLIRALRARLFPEGMAASVPKFTLFFTALGAGSALAGILGYKFFMARQSDWEGFWAFGAAVLGSAGVFIMVARQYFIWKLKGKPLEADFTQHRYGVKDENWPEDLKFQFSLYSTAAASAIMGFLVWAVRDSLPPEGPFLAVLQRTLISVAAGVFVYLSAGTSLMTREYEELRAALGRRVKREP